MGQPFHDINQLHEKLSKDVKLYLTVIILVSILSAGVVWQFIGIAHSSISIGFHLVLVFYFGATVLLSYVSFNGRRKELRQKKSQQDRLKEYNEAVGIKWLLWATIAFLAVVSLYISGEQLFLLYVLATIALFIFDYPSKNRLDKDIYSHEVQN